MKVKIEIKNRFTGKVLFEFETENNTIQKTVEEAIKSGCDLSGCDLSFSNLRGCNLSFSNLSGCDLSFSDLRGCNLSGCDLSFSDLRGCNLRGCNLSFSNLRGCDLSGCDLRGCDLSGCDLRGCDLSGKTIKTAAVFTGLYTYIVIPYITEDNEKRIKLGCHDRLLSEWESDFWNNNDEFPNDGSIKSESRLMAFKSAKMWFEIIDKTV